MDGDLKIRVLNDSVFAFTRYRPRLVEEICNADLLN
jgi:hypothetical protein